MSPIPDWARAYGLPEVEGHIRQSASDFEVTEVLGYEPSGSGEHDFLWVEKSDANTPWVAGQLARFAGVRSADVGFAGMKDRKALTRQWFSVRRPKDPGTDWAAFELPGVRILRAARHARKLRRGALTGNRFRIAIRGTGAREDALAARLEVVRERGVPNYFGAQRFGRDGNNLEQAERLFAGRRTHRSNRGIVLSAARSFLFNVILDRRVRDGTWDRLLPGECACLDGSNSFFVVDRIDAQLEARLDALDIHPGGALWGRGLPLVTGAVLAEEQAAVAPFPEFREGLERHLDMSRRALRLAVRELAWQFDTEAVWLEFSLAKGGYATAVLREIAACES